MTRPPGKALPPAIVVRQIPPGISGADLQERDAAALRPGAVWLRGVQRVRIRAVTPTTVTVSELDHGSSTRRRMRRAAFLRTSRPEVTT